MIIHPNALDAHDISLLRFLSRPPRYFLRFIQKKIRRHLTQLSNSEMHLHASKNLMKKGKA
jgi:hypothetical protein